VELSLPAYVLGGGRSARMGQDKARLPVEGTAMALRVARALREAGCAPVHLVGKDPSLADLGLPLVLDLEPETHALMGVATALAHAAAAGATHAVTCPCDLPWLDAAAVARLLAAGEPAVATDGSQRQPLLALLPVSRGPALLQAARDGTSVRAALADLPAVSLPPTALRNANRPQDLEAPRDP